MLMKSIFKIHRAMSRFHLSTSALILTFALLAWSARYGPAEAAMLAPKDGEEAGPKDWPANPAQHQVVIKREATDAKQSAMITAAEAAQAAKDKLIKAHQEDAGQPPIPQGDKVWWYEEKLGIRIPYAITNDAITYYSDLVAKNAKQAFKSYAMPSSRLDYHAGVEFHQEFKLDEKIFTNVNVVTLKLNFSANFTAEATSGLSFEKKRIVILDVDNKVLLISGDGPTEAMVLML